VGSGKYRREMTLYLELTFPLLFGLERRYTDRSLRRRWK